MPLSGVQPTAAAEFPRNQPGSEPVCPPYQNTAKDGNYGGGGEDSSRPGLRAPSTFDEVRGTVCARTKDELRYGKGSGEEIPRRLKSRTLLFESRFEGGNLSKAWQVGDSGVYFEENSL